MVAQQYLPDRPLDAGYYKPTGNGFERTVASRLHAIRQVTGSAGDAT